MKIIGIIPARYKSSRFPGKPLADIHGKPMIWWVYQNALKVNDLNEIYIATDDNRIKKECERLDLDVIMTSEKHPTGTDRICEVAKKIDADLYVNIQGDEPLVKGNTIQKAIDPLKKEKMGYSVTNLMTEIKDLEDLIDATVPKVVVNAKSEAVYLSRSAIPYPKKRAVTFFKQVCIYGFNSESLENFSKFKRGPAEEAEDIELLRFIEHNVKVKMIEVKQDTISVDTPSDLEVVREIIGKRIF